jgi:hypothetical protein
MRFYKMYDLLSSLQRPQDIPYCVRVTLGFYDPVNHFFQTKHCTDTLHLEGIASVRHEIPMVVPYDGFQKFIRVRSTKWDMRVDFVAPTKQAIFVTPDGVQAVASEQFLQRMSADLVRMLSLNAEVVPYESDERLDFILF